MENTNRFKTKIVSREQDYSQWYLDVSKRWEMYENSPTPGCITFLPKAVSIWDWIKNNVSDVLKSKWVQDIYLPLLIPMSFLEKEKDHVEWFAPELAVVTHAWWKKLQEDLAIRPTSETMFCDFFKKNLRVSIVNIGSVLNGSGVTTDEYDLNQIHSFDHFK